MKKNVNLYLFIILLFLLNHSVLNAQITAPGSSSSVETTYPAFPERDSIYIFCTGGQGNMTGTLQAQTALAGTKTFLWEKYNPETLSFETHSTENTDLQTSTISLLPDGGYRVTVSQGENTEIYRAWVFNNWNSANAAIPDSLSNCDSFRLVGSFDSPSLVYYDPATNAPVELTKNVMAEWKTGDVTVASVLSPQFFNPPFTSTDYTLRVYDQFGCEATQTVTYDPIAPHAQFSVDFGDQMPNELEAPLTVQFINESLNADADQYEWFFYRDLDDIKEESENSQNPVDSIMRFSNQENPEFTYEQTGTYMVKLVAKNISESGVCADTFFMPEYIIIQPSFIEAPNVFTPNNDGINDSFVVKFRSMQSIKIQIFNRWGKRIHFWESDDVRGFDDSFSASVWDGKLGGRFASPGVYYYVVEGQGRDNINRKANGFFHLFRGKD